MTDPKKNKPAELTEEQLTGVSGGEEVEIHYLQPNERVRWLQPIELLPEQLVVQPMGFKYCAANPEHVYPEIHEACPICGCKEFTRA